MWNDNQELLPVGKDYDKVKLIDYLATQLNPNSSVEKSDGKWLFKF